MATLLDRIPGAGRPAARSSRRRGRGSGRPQLTHFGGLDGLRGVAVIAVILYHGGVVWATGGFLGVEVFFVLSGFLITSLLVEEWQHRASIGLRAFWGRRARRLLPALFVLVVVIGIYYTAAGSDQAVPGFLGDGLSAVFYFSNWHQVAAGTSYFASSGPISPFQHTWSLSIEEQFYVIWPLLVLGIMGWTRRRGGRRAAIGSLRLMLAVTLLGLLASAVEMGLLFDGGRGLDRVYYGTDTRATGLLAGAALAFCLAIRRWAISAADQGPGAGRRNGSRPSGRTGHGPGINGTGPGSNGAGPTGGDVLGANAAMNGAAHSLNALAAGANGAGGNGAGASGAGVPAQKRSLFNSWITAFGTGTEPARPRSRPTRAELTRAGRFSRGSGLVLLGLLLIMYLANGSSAWLYPYGFLLVDAGTVLLIVSVVLRPASMAARALSLPALQALGQISYGLYLWHFPLFLWLDTHTTGLSGLHLLMFRLGVTLLVSAASYVLVEQPIRQRRLPTIQVRRLTPLALVAAVAAILVASSASVMPSAVPAAAHLPKPPPRLSGTDPACAVQLIDQPGYGLAPVPASQQAQFEYTSLGKHQLTWEGKTTGTFHTCPPKRVMLIGDSLAFTLGVPFLGDEQHYGVEMANAATLGCAFATRGELNVNGTWKLPDPGCQTALSTWAHDEAFFHPSEVVVEMGYRDEFDWSWNGVLKHLGDRDFDAYEMRQIERYVTVLGQGGTKILFLTVPYTNPPAQADGAPAPAASPIRHYDMNWMLHRVAQQHPGQVSVVNLDQTISPNNQYTSNLNGELCRFDGIHFTIFCAKLLEPTIMSAAQKLMGG